MDLLQLELYDIMLAYVQKLWSSEANIVSIHSRIGDNEPFIPFNVCAFPFVDVGGVRFGASTHHRGQNDSAAYLQEGEDTRVAVQIERIFQLTHRRNSQYEDSLVTTCAVVRKYIPCTDIVFPWSIQ